MNDKYIDCHCGKHRYQEPYTECIWCAYKNLEIITEQLKLDIGYAESGHDEIENRLKAHLWFAECLLKQCGKHDEFIAGVKEFEEATSDE